MVIIKQQENNQIWLQ